MASDVLDRPAVAPVAGRRRARVTEGRVVFLVALVVYAGLACWLVWADLIPQDAISRTANGYYTLFSRDPHLAAVGIVWNPLPSLVLLPALPLAALAPSLAGSGLIAALYSAVFMAVSVAVANDTLRRLGLARAVRLTLTVLLALHPMVLLYSGNGMSEAMFLCFLLLATRGLLRWFADGRPERLVSLGLALALAYGARYEALAPGLAAPVAVFLVSWWRGNGRGADRAGTARTDAVLAIFPVLVSVGLWAACGKIVANQWFATFSSEYGNAAQVAANRADIESATGSTVGDRSGYVLHQLCGLEPLILPVLLAAALLAVLRKDVRSLAPVAVLGSVLVFDNLAFLLGSSFGWLRFQLTAVPLVVLLVGILLAHQSPATARVSAASRVSAPARVSAASRRRLAVAAGVLAVAVALPATVGILLDTGLAREESAFLNADGAARTRYLARLNLDIGADLDALRLPDGAVLTDSAYSYAIILTSRRPKQFVISSDRDFAEILADPRGHHVRYFLVSTKGAADAVRAAYPKLDINAAGTRVWFDDQGRTLFTLVPA